MWKNHLGSMTKSAALMMALLLVGGSSAAAQVNQEAIERIDDLEFLEGTWRGEGWIMGREGRIELPSTELVQKKLGGTAMLVEGTHRGVDEDGEVGDVLFEALALVTYNHDEDRYDWRSSTSRGMGGNFEARIAGENVLEWGREGSFRYIIEVDPEGRWRETGENTGDDGETWQQFFEMTLHNVDAGAK